MSATPLWCLHLHMSLELVQLEGGVCRFQVSIIIVNCTDFMVQNLQIFVYLHPEIGLTVQTEPSTISVLDAMPYNTLSIVCTASVPTSIVATKSFVWHRGSSGASTVITPDDNTRITTLNPGNPTSTSMLTANVSSAGTYLYTCDVTALSSQSSATTTVIINGR